MAAGPASKPRADAAITKTCGGFGGERKLIGPLGEVGTPPYVVHYSAAFTKDMGDKDIKRIIKALAYRGMGTVFEHREHNVDTIVIIFEAIYVSWGDDPRELWQIPEAAGLAQLVLDLGWDGLCALPSTWGAKTIWNLIADKETYSMACRTDLTIAATISHFVARRIGVQAIRMEYPPEGPDFRGCISHFKKVYPNFRHLPGGL